MNSKWHNAHISGMAGILAIMLFAGAPAWASPPETVNVHGALVDAEGAPLSGVRAYVVRFFDAQIGGVQLGGDVTGTVQVSAEGLFNLPVALPATALDAPALWYELGIDTDAPPDGDAGDDIFPQRIRAHSVPFALEAGTAAHVDASRIGGGTVSNTEFNYLAGVTQPIQPALDAKANAADFSNVDNTSDLDKPVSTATQALLDGKLPRISEAYVVVEVTANVLTNGANLRNAYDAAKALTPFGSALSATNRAVVLVPPGRYNLGDSALIINADFVDLVGMSTSRDNQYIYRNSGTVLSQSASDVRIENLVFHYTGSADTSYAYNPTVFWTDVTIRIGSPAATRIRNCEFRASNRIMPRGATFAGFYEDCVADGEYVFGSGSRETAFGTLYGTASGTFINCTGGNYSFGANGTASGTFTNCTGGIYAFGGYGTASGAFINCTGGGLAFGGGGGTASGTFTNCTGGAFAFGGSYGTASGIFRNCIGDMYAFGGSNGTTTDGSFYGCHMTGNSYTATFRGRMEDCRWNDGITCGAEARIYRSTILGNVNLNSTAAGIAHSAVKGNIQNAGSASFNTGNLESTSVN